MRPPIYTVASDRRGAPIPRLHFSVSIYHSHWFGLSGLPHRPSATNTRLPCENCTLSFHSHILSCSESEAESVLQEVVLPGHAPSRFTVRPYLPATGIVATTFTMPKRMLPLWLSNAWSTWRSRRISNSNTTMLSKPGRTRPAVERMKKNSYPPVSSLDLRMMDIRPLALPGTHLGIALGEMGVEWSCLALLQNEYFIVCLSRLP